MHCNCFRYELQSRGNKKDKVEGEVHLAVHLKVDKSKLPDKLEVEKQYEALLAATVINCPLRDNPNIKFLKHNRGRNRLQRGHRWLSSGI